MSRAELLSSLTQIFRENFANEEIVLSMATTAADIHGWDSAKTVLLVLAVEDSFGIRFNSREIDGLRSISDWVLLIEKLKRV